MIKEGKTTMSMKTSDFFVQRLKEWGVTRIYGYPGDGINGVLGAIQRANEKGEGIEFIQVRHEEMAAFMAAGHAKFTGELGVCLSTGGPGATHLLTGLYDAKMDHAPVLAIAGQAEATARGASYQQEMNLDRVFADVANFVQEAAAPAQVRHLVDRGVRIAKAQNGVAVLIIPKDIQDEEWQSPPHLHGFTHSGSGYQRPKITPYEADLQRAADVLNAGNKVAILIGSGARGAAVEVVQAANQLGAGVAKALLGKDVLPDDAPFVTGSIGLLGTKPSWELMQHCDTLLMIGSGFPWTEFLPKEGQARAVQIDIDPAMLGLRYPCEVNLHGDAAETLRALLPLLDHKEDRSWRCRFRTGGSRWKSERWHQPIPSIPNGWCGRCLRSCRITLSSLLIPDPVQTGLRAIIASSRDNGPRCQAGWPVWVLPSLMRSRPNLRTLNARLWRWWVMAPCR